MTNILEAINNIISHKNFHIKDIYLGKNRVNNMGDALENFVKDAFADTFANYNENDRLETVNQKFSWTGSQNDPAKLEDCKVIKFIA